MFGNIQLLGVTVMALTPAAPPFPLSGMLTGVLIASEVIKTVSVWALVLVGLKRTWNRNSTPGSIGIGGTAPTNVNIGFEFSNANPVMVMAVSPLFSRVISWSEESPTNTLDQASEVGLGVIKPLTCFYLLSYG